jgi:hypothetical protein
MFSTNRGDVVLPATIGPLPKLTLEQLPQAPPRAAGRSPGLPHRAVQAFTPAHA